MEVFSGSRMISIFLFIILENSFCQILDAVVRQDIFDCRALFTVQTHKNFSEASTWITFELHVLHALGTLDSLELLCL